jgi:hypothetical protein
MAWATPPAALLKEVIDASGSKTTGAVPLGLSPIPGWLKDQCDPPGSKSPWGRGARARSNVGHRRLPAC